MNTEARSASLATVVQKDLLPTPNVADATGGRTSKGSKRPGEGGLRMALLPTPASGGNKETCHNQISGQFRTGMKKALDLLPAPKGSPSGPDYARAGREGSGGDDLATALAKEMLPTPSASVIEPRKNVTKLEGRTPQDPQVGLADKMGGSLKPTFVAWMMGWPLRWLELPAPTGGPRGRRGRASRPSPPESPSAPTSCEPLETGGFLNAPLTWLDAFRRGWTAAMRERSE